MNSVEEVIETLTNELLSDNHGKGNAIYLYEQLLKAIVHNNVPSENRRGAAMIVNDYIKRAKNERY